MNEDGFSGIAAFNSPTRSRNWKPPGAWQRPLGGWTNLNVTSLSKRLPRIARCGCGRYKPSTAGRITFTLYRHPDDVRDQLKAWCARKLNELERTRYPNATQQRWRWFAERGSNRYVNDDDALEAVILYVRDAQD